MNKTILKFTLIILALGSSFFAWQSVDAAINVAEASNWLMPTLWFSALFIVLALSIVLIKEASLVFLEAFLVLALSLIFAPSFWHGLVILFSFLLLLLAIGRIRNDLHLNIRISLWKTIRTGSTVIVVVLGLVITSQYYFSVKDAPLGKIIPKFKMEGLSSSLTSKIISALNPDFKNLDDKNLTVDQLILETQKKQLEQADGGQIVPDAQINALIDQQLGENIPVQQREALKAQYLQKVKDQQSKMLGENQDLILEQARKQLADMVGVEITGQEKVSDLFSEVINSKINNYIVPNLSGDKNFPILPIIMTFILFLTVVPLGSFLSPLWILIVSLIFRLLVAAEVVKIKKVMTEVEVLE
ncbi:MAG: hypothetical protein WC238_03395 [Parcubacteria group bacterium]|jgi:hypothetical protein